MQSALKKVTLLFSGNPLRKVKVLSSPTFLKIWQDVQPSLPPPPQQKRVGGGEGAHLELSGELHKSEVLLIASTLLAVKAENIYRNTIKMHKPMETELRH